MGVACRRERLLPAVVDRLHHVAQSLGHLAEVRGEGLRERGQHQRVARGKPLGGSTQRLERRGSVLREVFGRQAGQRVPDPPQRVGSSLGPLQCQPVPLHHRGVQVTLGDQQHEVFGAGLIAAGMGREQVLGEPLPAPRCQVVMLLAKKGLQAFLPGRQFLLEEFELLGLGNWAGETRRDERFG